MGNPVPGPLLERRDEERLAERAGLYVPKWALVAGGILIAIVSASWSAAQTVARAKSDAEIMQLRLCRIERAVGLEPWPTCPSMVKP